MSIVISLYISAMTRYRYLHHLYSSHFPHLCYYHNVSVVVSYGLHQVYINPGNLQGILNRTFYFMYVAGRLFFFFTLSMTTKILSYSFKNWTNMFRLFPPISSSHFPVQGLNWAGQCVLELSYFLRIAQTWHKAGCMECSVRFELTTHS